MTINFRRNALQLSVAALFSSAFMANAADIPQVKVTVTDKQCEPMTITVNAGKTQFIIQNHSQKALEWEILKGVMVVAPSDHLILNENLYKEDILAGFDFVENHDALLTLGIKPNRPETGYGYIQVGEMSDTDKIMHVKTFTEKPNLELAKVFVESGEFFWNSGIFLWSADSIIKALKDHAPDVCDKFEAGKEHFGTETEQSFINDKFPACPNISIDFAVMEKTPNVFVSCVNFGWNDLGTWGVLYEYSPKSKEGNVSQNCNAMLYNCHNNMIAAKPGKLIVASGLKNFIVADSDDVLLICPQSEEQRIKQYVNDVKSSFGDKYL